MKQGLPAVVSAGVARVVVLLQQRGKPFQVRQRSVCRTTRHIARTRQQVHDGLGAAPHDLFQLRVEKRLQRLLHLAACIAGHCSDSMTYGNAGRDQSTALKRTKGRGGAGGTHRHLEAPKRTRENTVQVWCPVHGT